MAKPFTLTQLRYFAVVAELENMTAAAERLLVTQSTLSTAMAQLEASLSTQLFVRLRTRGLRLTPSGRQLAQDIKVLLAAWPTAASLRVCRSWAIHSMTPQSSPWAPPWRRCGPGPGAVRTSW